MLGKLAKYEFKSTVRIFPMLYAGLIALSIMNRMFYFGVLSDIDNNFVLELIRIITTTMYGLVIFGTCAGMIVVAIQRFRGNLLGDEGYLMFTLPVKSWQLVFSKMIVMAVWAFFSIIFVTLSAFIISGEDVFRLLREMADGFGELAHFVGPAGLTELILCVVLGLFFFTLPIFASISVGSLWRKHRTLGAFFSFIALSFATQVITGVFIYQISEKIHAAYQGSPLNYFTATEAEWIAHNRMVMHQFMIPFLILLVAFSAVFFFLTVLVLDKKLDLE